MRMKVNLKFWLAAIVILSLTMRLWISWLPVPVLVEKIMVDDTFYSLSISKSIANGNGITYDGVDPTNGFQPLWPIMVVPLIVLAQSLSLSVNLILTLASIIDVLTVIVVYLLARKVFDERIALVAAALYGLNPLIIFQSLSGIDVILSTFFVAFTIYFYLQNKDRPSTRSSIMLGSFIGLAILARLDNVFLLAAIGLHMIFTNRKRLYPAFKSAFLVSVIAVAIVSSWLLWSLLNIGTIMPTSGTARYNMNHGISPFFDYATKSTLQLTEENLLRAFGVIFHQLGVVDFNMSSLAVLLPIALAAILLLSLKNTRKLDVYLLYAAMIFSFYGFYFLGVQIRYFTPFMPAVIILLASGISVLSGMISKKASIFYLISVLILLAILFNGYYQWDSGYFKWQVPLYNDALWMKANTTQSDIMASFNSGIMSFFSDRRVINLDGAVNPQVLGFLANKTVMDYMKEKNVSYWVDIAWYNQTAYDDFRSGNFTISILQNSYYARYLGNGTQDLSPIDQTYGFYRHLRGFDVLIAFFKYKLI
jgi:asparagine N-glycosylation enzyme membrane subunit Stt3